LQYFILLIDTLALKYHTTVRLGDVVVFENRQPLTAAKFITKSSLLVLSLGIIRRLELMLNSGQS
jgi:hypothetical protein